MINLQWQDGQKIEVTVGKVVCVGRNYVEHAQELNNEVPTEPLLFIKPSSSLASMKNDVNLPSRLGEHHYEAELALLIGDTINANTDINLHQHIAGIGVGLDLTLRALQSRLKEHGHPWEKAKAYDNSCIISSFLPVNSATQFNALQFSLSINQEVRQKASSSLMVFPIAELLKEISLYFTLRPGDIVLTGTPKGVGQLCHADQLSVTLENEPLASCTVHLI